MKERKIQILVILALLASAISPADKLGVFEDLNIYMHRNDSHSLHLETIFGPFNDAEEEEQLQNHQIEISGEDSKSVNIDDYLPLSRPQDSLSFIEPKSESQKVICKNYKPTLIEKEDTLTYMAICYPSGRNDKRTTLREFTIQQSSNGVKYSMASQLFDHPQIEGYWPAPEIIDFHVFNQDRIVYFGFEKKKHDFTYVTIATRQYHSPNKTKIPLKILKVNFYGTNFKIAISQVEDKIPTAVFYQKNSEYITFASLDQAVDKQVDSECSGDFIKLLQNLTMTWLNYFSYEFKDFSINHIHFDTPSRGIISAVCETYYLKKNTYLVVFVCDFDSITKFTNCQVEKTASDTNITLSYNHTFTAIPHDYEKKQYIFLTNKEVFLVQNGEVKASTTFTGVDRPLFSPRIFEKVRGSQRDEYYAVFRNEKEEEGIILNDYIFIHNIQISENGDSFKISANIRTSDAMTSAIVTPQHFSEIQGNLVITSESKPCDSKSKINIEGSRFNFLTDQIQVDGETQQFTFDVQSSKFGKRTINVYLSDEAGQVRLKSEQNKIIKITTRIGELTTINPHIDSVYGNNVSVDFRKISGQESQIKFNKSPYYFEQKQFKLDDKYLSDYRFFDSMSGITLINPLPGASLVSYFTCLESLKKGEEIVCFLTGKEFDIKGKLFGGVHNGPKIGTYYFATRDNKFIYLHRIDNGHITSSPSPILAPQDAHDFVINVSDLILNRKKTNQALKESDKVTDVVSLFVLYDYTIKQYYTTEFSKIPFREIIHDHNIPTEVFCPQHLFIDGYNNIQISSNCNMERLKRKTRQISFTYKYRFYGIDEEINGEKTESRFSTGKLNINEDYFSSGISAYSNILDHKQFIACKVGDNYQFVDMMNNGDSYVTDLEGRRVSIDLKRLILNLIPWDVKVVKINYYCVQNSKYVTAKLNDEYFIYLRLGEEDILNNSMVITIDKIDNKASIDKILFQYYDQKSHNIISILRLNNKEKIHKILNLKYDSGAIGPLKKDDQDPSFWITYSNIKRKSTVLVNAQIIKITDQQVDIQPIQNIEDLEVKTYNLEKLAKVTGPVCNTYIKSKMNSGDDYFEFVPRLATNINDFDLNLPENYSATKTSDQFTLIITQSSSQKYVQNFVRIFDIHSEKYRTNEILLGTGCLSIQAIEQKGIIIISAVCHSQEYWKSELVFFTFNTKIQKEWDPLINRPTDEKRSEILGSYPEIPHGQNLLVKYKEDNFINFYYIDKLGVRIQIGNLSGKIEFEQTEFSLLNGEKYVNIQAIQDKVSGNISFLCVLKDMQNVDVYTISADTDSIHRSKLIQNNLHGDLLEDFSCNQLTCGYITKHSVKLNNYSISQPTINGELEVRRENETVEFIIPKFYSLPDSNKKINISEKIISLKIKHAKGRDGIAVFKRSQESQLPEHSQLFALIDPLDGKIQYEKYDYFHLEADDDQELGNIYQISSSISKTHTIQDMKLIVKSNKLKMKNLNKNIGLKLDTTEFIKIFPMDAFFNQTYIRSRINFEPEDYYGGSSSFWQKLKWFVFVAVPITLLILVILGIGALMVCLAKKNGWKKKLGDGETSLFGSVDAGLSETDNGCYNEFKNRDQNPFDYPKMNPKESFKAQEFKQNLNPNKFVQFFIISASQLGFGVWGLGFGVWGLGFC